MRNFKLDRKGFTLIELLAVITILGILMLILIPSVSRIIENSRKNTFLSTAKNYANAVRDEWAADNLYCSRGSGTGAVTNKLASSLNTGQFYIYVQSEDVGGASAQLPSAYSNGTAQNALSNFEQLINSGGRSSWGNNEIYGYVRVHVHESDAENAVTDENKLIGNLIRSDVKTTGAEPTAPQDNSYSCIVS